MDEVIQAAGKRWELRGTPAALHYNNCAYAWILQMMLRLARENGRLEDVELYASRLEHLQSAIHRAYYDPEKAVYVDSDQMRQAFALLANVPPEQERQRVVDSLIHEITNEKPYFDTGNATPLFIRILTEVLDRPDIVLDALLRQEYPGYAWLVNQGATTWPEYWDGDKSQIHTTFTGIAWWLIHGLGGIRPDPAQPGFRNFTIRPLFTEKIDWLDVSRESAYGHIGSSWKREGDEVRWDVVVPPNTMATVVLPVHEQRAMVHDGESISVTENSGRLEVLVGSGNHHFRFSSSASY